MRLGALARHEGDGNCCLLGHPFDEKLSHREVPVEAAAVAGGLAELAA